MLFSGKTTLVAEVLLVQRQRKGQYAVTLCTVALVKIEIIIIIVMIMIFDVNLVINVNIVISEMGAAMHARLVWVHTG